MASAAYWTRPPKIDLSRTRPRISDQSLEMRPELVDALPDGVQEIIYTKRYSRWKVETAVRFLAALRESLRRQTQKRMAAARLSLALSTFVFNKYNGTPEMEQKHGLIARLLRLNRRLLRR